MSDINNCPFIEWPSVTLDKDAINQGLQEIEGSGTLHVSVELKSGTLGVPTVVHACRQRGGTIHDYLVIDETQQLSMTHDFALVDVAEGDEFTFDVFAIGPNFQGVMSRARYETTR